MPYLFHCDDHGWVYGREFVDHVLEVSEEEARDLLRGPAWRVAEDHEVEAAMKSASQALEEATTAAASSFTGLTDDLHAINSAAEQMFERVPEPEKKKTAKKPSVRIAPKPLPRKQSARTPRAPSPTSAKTTSPPVEEK